MTEMETLLCKTFPGTTVGYFTAQILLGRRVLTRPKRPVREVQKRIHV